MVSHSLISMYKVNGSLWNAYRIRIRKGVNLFVIADTSHGFDHVSVSVQNDTYETIERTPTWAEMDFVKKIFFKPEEVAYQLHVPEKDSINNHPYVLHLWRHTEKEIPLPPKYLVGLEVFNK